jgi:membrane protease subunit HflK
MFIGLILVVVVTGATGVVVVLPGESVIVRRFGRVLPQAWGPGLHVGLPRGIDRIERLRLEEVRRIELGLAESAGPNDDPGAGEYLTGDLNLIHARAVVQYRVADPVRFVLAASDREMVLQRLAESSLAKAFSKRPIDAALRDGRSAIAGDVQDDLDRGSRAYGLGLSILGVSLTDAQPPIEVQPDFAAAQAARSDRERKINEAKSRSATVLIEAKSKAQAIGESSKAESERTVGIAKAKAARFLSMLVEAERSRRLTVKKLYLDGMLELLPKVRRKILMTPDEAVDLSLFGINP